MGKRSDFPRRAQDAYDTPPEAVLPLIPHLPGEFSFCEPCAGKAALSEALKHFTNTFAAVASEFDVEPRMGGIPARNALSLTLSDLNGAEYIITNPPWTRQILHPMIEHFAAMRPTWLLFDADWMHTKQAEPYLKLCQKIVSVGRVKWIPDSPHTGKDNCAWYLFDANAGGPTEFIGRAA